MGKKLYHNPSKGLMNETCPCDFLETFTLGDNCYYTEEGNAMLYKVEHDDIVDLINMCEGRDD